MIIKNIEFENFRPFYGQVTVDLTPEDDKNIILIGGRNGHGKSNFLLGIVWCLYGELIKDVDETFKAEITKTNGYAKFLDDALNRDSKSEGKHRFGVKCTFHDVPHGGDEAKSIIHVYRYYHTDTRTGSLEIEPDDDGLLSFSSDEEKQSFINDYLVPIEIAKFVFFNAENISQIADLTIVQQAKLLNKTLGNMLGLNSYQNVENELEAYVKKLQKSSADQPVQEKITNFENSIESCKKSIANKSRELKIKNNEIHQIEEKITELELVINRRGGDDVNNINILHKKKENLEKQREQAKKEFYDVADIVPLMMLSGLIQEAKGHIEIEAEIQAKNIAKKNFSEKNDLFIEQLFNKGKLPEPDISMNQKIFYANKSKELATCFLDDQDDQNEPEDQLLFSHDLDPSKAKHLAQRYKDIQSKSSTGFDAIVSKYTKTKNDLTSLEREIKQLEINSADEITKELIAAKQTHQSRRDQLLKETGSISTDITRLEQEQSSTEAKLKKHYALSKTNEFNRKRIELAEKYIKVLGFFIRQEKEQKKEDIKNKLLAELKELWSKELVIDAKLSLLPNDVGLEVTLLDKNGKSISSKDLSKGEQQLYISALLKAILDNSIHDLPVFIDTPLARLDSEHRDNILQKYYPNLSTQVVVFSTDTEITPEKHKDIQDHVTKSYLIMNKNNKSSISSGYFQQV